VLKNQICFNLLKIILWQLIKVQRIYTLPLTINTTALQKTFVETADKVEIIATEENLTLISNKKIQLKGNK
jgi:hypothetical protein